MELIRNCFQCRLRGIDQNFDWAIIQGGLLLLIVHLGWPLIVHIYAPVLWPLLNQSWELAPLYRTRLDNVFSGTPSQAPLIDKMWMSFCNASVSSSVGVLQVKLFNTIKNIILRNQSSLHVSVGWGCNGSKWKKELFLICVTVDLLLDLCYGALVLGSMLRCNCWRCITRQLPMGSGHCP